MRQGTSQNDVFDVKACVEQNLHLMEDLFRREGIELILESASEGLMCAGDPLRFAQVHMNLLSNAKDILREKDCTARWIRTRVSLEQGKIAITVTDSGPGVPEGARDKLFTKFYTTKPAGKGTGLGLSYRSR